jgi:hypothetical protein
MAKVRELDHVLREALDRLADADQRITQLAAESTRFRDNVLPATYGKPYRSDGAHHSDPFG